MRKIFVTCFIAIYISVCGVVLGEDKAKMTIKAVDEEGKSVVGMPVSITFYAGAKNKGVTDTNGLFALEGDAASGESWYGTRKENYYESRGRYQFSLPIDGRWQPWNPVITSVVRRIVNPIPMYAKHVETKIPRTNEWFGYDLLKADWVQPVGIGLVSDLVFKVDGTWKDSRNYDETLVLEFSRTNDGTIPVHYDIASGRPTGSALFMPRIAHVGGYKPFMKWHQRKGMEASATGNADPESGILGRGYIIRVRSETNEEGVVTNAFYGKLSRDITFIGQGEKPSYLGFTYYLNPTPNDRNLEFDPKRNLMKNLKSTEQVNMP